MTGRGDASRHTNPRYVTTSRATRPTKPRHRPVGDVSVTHHNTLNDVYVTTLTCSYDACDAYDAFFGLGKPHEKTPRFASREATAVTGGANASCVTTGSPANSLAVTR